MQHDNSASYEGQELSIFAEATNWKQYWSSSVRKWICGDVLEVGAGIGANTHLLHTPEVRSWHCLEPDASLCKQLIASVSNLPDCSVSCGAIGNISETRFDCILYIDVLEHIQADHSEMLRASMLLRPGGHLVVLSPAHQFLFSPFDESIGHYRRYNRRTLLFCSPIGCQTEAVFYLDSLGVALSFANRLLLRQSIPTARQLQIWDRMVIPMSKVVDGIFRRRIGKSIVGVWKRPSDTDEELEAR